MGGLIADPSAYGLLRPLPCRINPAVSVCPAHPLLALPPAWQQCPCEMATPYFEQANHPNPILENCQEVFAALELLAAEPWRRAWVAVAC